MFSPSAVADTSFVYYRKLECKIFTLESSWHLAGRFLLEIMVSIAFSFFSQVYIFS